MKYRIQIAEQGLTLVEVLVALIILGIAMSVVFGAMLSNTRMNNTVEERAKAVRVYEEVMEKYRTKINDPGFFEKSNQMSEVADIESGGKTYTVITTFCRSTARPDDDPEFTTKFACSKLGKLIEVEVKLGEASLYQGGSYLVRFGKA